MRLDSIRLDRYGPLSGFEQDTDGGLEVLYGPNEAGKTLVLEGVLELLAPDGADAFDRLDRVDGSPVGEVVVSRNGEDITFDGESSLADAVGISARELRNVFVVRDSDLRLDGEHAFFDSVTDRIGDLHTSELQDLRDELVDHGRLTPSELKVSDATANDGARTVRDDAAALAAEVRDYVETAQQEEYDELEARLLAARRERRTAEEALAAQERARRAHRHQTLSERLATYREATAVLADVDVTDDDLDRLGSEQRTLAAKGEAIDALEAELGERRETVSDLEGRLADVEAELAPLERREAAVEAVATAHDAAPVGGERPGREARWFAAGLAIAGVATGGLGAAVGSAPVGLAALGVGLLAVGGWLVLSRRRRSRRRAASDLVRQAGEAGLDVDAVGDVPRAVRAFEDRLAALRQERDDLAEDLRLAKSRLEDREDDLVAAKARRDEAREAIDSFLATAGFESVAACEAAVERREAAATERRTAGQFLVEGLGDPESDDPAECIDHWEEALTDLTPPEDIDPETFDEARLEDLEETVADLDDRIERLETDLADHRRRLEGFERRLAGLTTEPFVGADLALSARTVAGLERAASDLERLVARVDRRADVARDAVAVVEAVRDAEAEKIADLFGEDGRAAAVFERITDGRYEGVSYDAGAETLRVHRADGTTLRPAQLSHGATAQLYLAARVSLAEQLLGGEPGFFLLDDPFLPADHDRLQRGFEVLADLAAAGWQVVYLTAKREVGEGVVAAFDLPSHRLDGPV
ncbi:ATP-binding protein [Halobacteriales archaeon Cl-PHB]